MRRPRDAWWASIAVAVERAMGIDLGAPDRRRPDLPGSLGSGMLRRRRDGRAARGRRRRGRRGTNQRQPKAVGPRVGPNLAGAHGPGFG